MFRDWFEGVFVQLRTLDHRGPLVEQPHQGAEEACLSLAPLAEQDDVVAGDQGTLELGKNGPAETVHPGPRITAGGKGGKQVAADLVTQVLEDMACCTQFTNGEDIGTIIHSSTVVPGCAMYRGTSAKFPRTCPRYEHGLGRACRTRGSR